MRVSERAKTNSEHLEAHEIMKLLQLSAGDAGRITHLSLPMNEKLKCWLAVVLWMAVIFVMSTDLGSGAHTSLIVDPLLRWLMPQISPAGIDRAHFLIRKAGHLTEYAILGILLWRAWAAPASGSHPAGRWKKALFSVLLAAAYAAGDEFHQSFVPSRGASVHDVMIDACGALLGLIVLWAFKSRSRRTCTRAQ